MRKRLFCLMLTLALLCCSCQKAASAVKRTATIYDVFDTAITVIGFTDAQSDFDDAVAYAKRRFGALHRLFDCYNEYEGVANVCTLNREAALAPVKVEPELVELLLFAKEWQPKLGNTCNIAMGAVLRLWHDTRANAEAGGAVILPTDEALQAAAKHVDYDTVILDADASTVFFTDPALKLDLGAIAKGYATEKVSGELIARGFTSFILNAGGNVRAGDPPQDGRARWAVSIQNPLDPASSDWTEVLYLTNLSVVTSGDYQRYCELDGVRYHHLISPQTLYPANENHSVTIVTENSTLGDLLSTAVFLMPYAQGRALIDSLDGVEALWVTADGAIERTDGLLPYCASAGAQN